MKRVAPLLLLLAGCDLLIPTPTVIGGGSERPREGEGEEGEGEGEEGEGEGPVGEGEGEEGEGEGEGPVGEGEGEEGEGEPVGDGPALLLQLTWAGDDADLDARGIRANIDGSFCAPSNFFSGSGGGGQSGPVATTCTPSELSCSFSNCQSGDAPDWGGDGVLVGPGDPGIDVDDTDGFGPENLNVASAADGTYLFGAFAYRVTGTECATLQIFVDGRQILNVSLPVQQGDWVELATVEVDGGTATLGDLLQDDVPCP